jgi:hypothetical protein
MRNKRLAPALIDRTGSDGLALIAPQYDQGVMLEPQPEDPRHGVGDRDYPFRSNPSERFLDLSLEFLYVVARTVMTFVSSATVMQDGVASGRTN